ncbi:hypothetical protein A3H75_02475, partial [Candidatus Uhrbacteria bacterium RIFCSPLOWO2_02_FULL_51_9]
MHESTFKSLQEVFGLQRVTEKTVTVSAEEAKQPQETLQELIAEMRAVLQKFEHALGNVISSSASRAEQAQALVPTQSERSREISLVRSLDSPFGLARDDRGVIDGVFDGKQMVADDGTLYPVPENYASKSKLLEGDLLQLVKTPDGRNYFKQTSRVPRRIKQARLVHIEASHGFVRTDDGGSYQILLAPLRFFRVNPGEQLTIEVPETGGVWAAVVGKIESWYTSQTYAGT